MGWVLVLDDAMLRFHADRAANALVAVSLGGLNILVDIGAQETCRIVVDGRRLHHVLALARPLPAQRASMTFFF